MGVTLQTADAYRHAEGRLKAMTREVGTLREELRNEQKKLARASGRAARAEEELKDAVALIKELQFTNKKLNQQLVSTKARMVISSPVTRK
jgi:septal ring factor EnvC (AmiA/AmiB activator)